ncbi:uncharacterized protein DUF1097 [Lachnotalea glycerini]|uniref:DUF1097 domain-containing protein n=1 Tax=Lachnotalea glycerini TaxID=1763509 RepID=A0A255IGP8_9FIRM|nr:DUF1097 domain-containing protein [Lachnotalea glycerini]PXV93340.1 uncharacterized protein DUF1097 [Lachnotalea glycerini]RDY31991.1 DUF1097 domain-containing protein [Lachnotalea glycerini]
MKFHKFIVIPFSIGVLAFILQLVDQSLSPILSPDGNSGFAWISFQAWAVYFFAGCNMKGGLKSYLNYITGIVAAIFMILLGQFVTPMLGSFSMPFALLVGCVIFLSLERVELFNLLPPMFISAGIYFGIITYVPNANFINVAVIVALYAFFGLFLGYISILFRQWYEEKQK